MSKPLITAKIDVTKINKAHLFKGKSGTYLDVAFFENEGESKYGDDGFIRQSVSKEARARGEKGEIIGNWKYLEAPQQPQQPRGRSSSPPLDTYAQPPKKPVFRAPPTPEPDLDGEDDVPF